MTEPTAQPQLPSAPGPIPASLALAEATPDSLAELMSRDPEHYTKQDLAAVVAALRASRAIREKAAADAAAGGKARRKTGGVKAADLEAPAKSSVSSDELFG